MGKLIARHVSCPFPSCGSSDAFDVYEDENGTLNGTCYSCGGYAPRLYKDVKGNRTVYRSALDNKIEDKSHEKSTESNSTPKTATTRKPNLKDSEQLLNEFMSYPIRPISDRFLSLKACEHYNVRVALSEEDGKTITSHLYPITKKSKLTSYKERVCESKAMFHRGTTKDPDLFGQSVCPAGGNILFITEGEVDCLTLFDVLSDLSTLPSWVPAVVSPVNGAKSALQEVSRNLDFVSSFNKVVLCFDMDEPGQQATQELCKLLADKAYVATFSEKDPNDMVKAGKTRELYWDVMKHPKKYMPDGVIEGGDETWARYKNKANVLCYPYPASWTELNRMTYGIRLGSVVTITSGTGMGKTHYLAELKDHYHRTTDFKFADISLEQDVGETIGALMSIYLNKRIQLPDVKVTEEEEKEAHDFYANTGRWSFYDHFGGMDDDNLFSKIRYFAATGHKFIYLDHLSIIVSEFASEGDERKRIDVIMTKLAKLAKEFNIVIFLVVHLRKSSDNALSFECGAVPSLDDLRGSGSIKQLSWDIIALSRNQQHPSKYCANTARVSVLKCRFTGRTGEADYLHFCDDKGRLEKVRKPDGYDVPKGTRFSRTAA